MISCIHITKLYSNCSVSAGDYDPYSNVYANQSYDPEGEDYGYEPTEKVDESYIHEWFHYRPSL